MSRLVRAAGGVVARRNAAGDVEVLLVHRPRYDDWTLPKGKLEDGERDEDAAVREVEEETGLTCALGPELRGASYTDSRDRPKVVRYWLMRAPESGARPQNEVDAVRWLPLDEALAALSYERDRDVLRSVPYTAV